MTRSISMNLARRIDTNVGLVASGLLFAFSRARARLGGPPQPALRATTPPRPGEAPARPHRILAVKFYGLGNIVMLLPVLGALRRAFPAAEIDFLTLAENRPLLERSGLVSRVLGVRHEGYGRVAADLARALRALRARRYDLTVDFEQFVKLSSILCFVTGARERIGFNTDGQRRGWLYTRRVVYTDSEHMSDIFMRLLRPLAIDTTPESSPLATRPEEEARAAALLAEAGAAGGDGPAVAVHLGSGANFYRIPLKRWPVERFARLCDELVARHRARILFTGKGSEERELIRSARAQMKHPATDACDRLSITELLALLRRCDLAVVNDTSVMHLAAAQRTPLVAFFGPTAPLHYGPRNPEARVFYRDLYCSPCLTNYNLKVSRCTDPVCIRSIPVSEVLESVERHFLAKGVPRRGAEARDDRGPEAGAVRPAAARSAGSGAAGGGA